MKNVIAGNSTSLERCRGMEDTYKGARARFREREMNVGVAVFEEAPLSLLLPNK